MCIPKRFTMPIGYKNLAYWPDMPSNDALSKRCLPRQTKGHSQNYRRDSYLCTQTKSLQNSSRSILYSIDYLLRSDVIAIVVIKMVINTRK